MEESKLLSIDSLVDCFNLINDQGFFICIKLKLDRITNLVDTTLRLRKKDCLAIHHALLHCYDDECCFLLFKYKFVSNDSEHRIRQLVLLVWTPKGYEESTSSDYKHKSVQLEKIFRPDVVVVCEEKKSAEFTMHSLISQKLKT